MFALRDLQEEKARLEKLLCRHQMELKTLKEQHEWAKSGEPIAIMMRMYVWLQVHAGQNQALSVTTMHGRLCCQRETRPCTNHIPFAGTCHFRLIEVFAVNVREG